jgi:hypothetical protein
MIYVYVAGMTNGIVTLWTEKSTKRSVDGFTQPFKEELFNDPSIGNMLKIIKVSAIFQHILSKINNYVQNSAQYLMFSCKIF